MHNDNYEFMLILYFWQVQYFNDLNKKKNVFSFRMSAQEHCHGNLLIDIEAEITESP